jgi:hypothetical protein
MGLDSSKLLTRDREIDDFMIGPRRLRYPRTLRNPGHKHGGTVQIETCSSRNRNAHAAYVMLLDDEQGPLPGCSRLLVSCPGASSSDAEHDNLSGL